MSILDMVSLGVVAMLLLWGAWALLKKFWPSTTTTDAGKATGKVVDFTQDLAAKAALQAIRFHPDIEGNPRALLAWSDLYSAIGGTIVIPVSIILPVVSPTETIAAVTVTPTAVVDPHAAEIDWRPGQ